MAIFLVFSAFSASGVQCAISPALRTEGTGASRRVFPEGSLCALIGRHPDRPSHTRHTGRHRFALRFSAVLCFGRFEEQERGRKGE
jgi:hypothetical protein